MSDSKNANPKWWHILITNWIIADPNYMLEVNGGPSRNYQVQKYSNMKHLYLFGGRLRTVKQLPLNLIVGGLMILLGILFWIFEASWFWHKLSPAIPIVFSYCWFISFTMFIKAATSDPGILPRNMHLPNYPTRIKDEDDKTIEGSSLDPIVANPDEYFNTITLPYYDDKYNGVNVKYCTTCHIWRPPRSSHCGVCNVCVVNHDHHCIYINNCVGLRNYKYFLWFVLFTVISNIYVTVTTFVHIFHYLSTDSNLKSFKHSIETYPGTFVTLILSILTLIYPLSILIIHICLTSQNLTTREYLNNVRPNKNFVHVFDTHSMLKNFYITWIGRSRGVSSFRLRDQSMAGDIRLENLPPLE